MKKEEIKEILKELAQLHPYKVKGKPETYSDYNQGWEDALGCIESKMESLTEQEQPKQIPCKTVGIECKYCDCWEKFNKQADENLKNRGTIDFSKQVKDYNKIIDKSKQPKQSVEEFKMFNYEISDLQRLKKLDMLSVHGEIQLKEFLEIQNILKEHTQTQRTVSDDEIHKEAFKRQKNFRDISFEFNMIDFKDGAKWMRNKLNKSE